MLDIKFIRDNLETVRQAAIDKGFDPAVVADLMAVDMKRREEITEDADAGEQQPPQQRHAITRKVTF